MSGRMAVMAVVSLLSAHAACAGDTSPAAFTQSLQDCARLVSSLRLDKVGQARVFASDGSEYTGGQAFWMRAQIKRIESADARGEHVEAARLLADLSAMVQAHQRSSLGGGDVQAVATR